MSDRDDSGMGAMMGKSDANTAGNAVSPREGRAYSGGQAKGDKSIGVGFGQKYTSPGPQTYSNKAFSGGQKRGVKGWTQDLSPNDITDVDPKGKMYIDKKGG